MFGYISINKPEMKFKEFDIYHSYYCGLCQTIKKRYGNLARLSLSYDCTFILMLLTGLYDPETKEGKCSCVFHPLEKHEVRTNVFSEYVADMNILFAVYHCYDDWEDEKKLLQLVYGNILNSKIAKYKDYYGDKINKIKRAMQLFSENERRGDCDADTMAGLFGNVLGEIIAVYDDEWNDNLKKLGFLLGKFIYLMDAYEDVEEDIKKNNFNPLKEKYQAADFDDSMKIIFTTIMSECCREFEILPIIDGVDILYSGIFTRFEYIYAKRKGPANEGDRPDGEKK